MPKKKLQRFAEMETFPNVFQPEINEQLAIEHELKGTWNRQIFKNDNPITLELGCGKGEYTLGLAERNADKNFIGIDIKGARIWLGAKTALERNMNNVAFLRTKIDMINSFFKENEVSEIWITFPDPQLTKPLKRLTSSRFLNRYRQLVNQDTFVNLKTDSQELYEYTKQLVDFNHLEIKYATNDLYSSEVPDEILNVKTFYEKQHLAAGKKICYIRFKLYQYQLIREVITYSKSIKDYKGVTNTICELIA